MTAEKTLITIEEVEANPPEGRWELLDGELVYLAPAYLEHNYLITLIASLLNAYVNPRRLGWVFSGDTGIILRRGPDRLRAPDVCFVARDRIPGGHLPDRFTALVPDLIVEVVSPGDRRGEIEHKTAEWLRSGAQLVWIVHPRTRTVVVADGAGQRRTLHEHDTLQGEPVLPGFSTPIAALFA
ncbi:MAG TPA: Uma2 family endonuclease [Dehalococcoidia bacterium]